MPNFQEINENHSGDLVKDLLGSIKIAVQEKIDYKMKVAAKIYAGLQKKEWKGLDLAKALDVKSPSLVSDWLSGTHNFTIDTLLDIQHVLGIQLLNTETNEPT